MDTQYDMVQKYLQIIRERGIRVTFCERFDDTSDIWCFETHNHPDIEMIYFRSGAADIQVSSEDIRISPYDVVVYPARAYHKESLMPAVRQEVVCLRVRVDGGLELEHPIHIKDYHQILGILFDKIHVDYHTQGRDGRIDLLQDYAKLLLMSCIVAHVESRSTCDFLDVVLEYISDHYCEKITVPELAAMVHVSDAYLNKRFRRANGMSIIKYVNMLRIEKAKHMLIATDYSIEHITTAVGFNSSKYFCRAFKAYTQMTPSDYRSQNAKRPRQLWP